MNRMRIITCLVLVTMLGQAQGSFTASEIARWKKHAAAVQIIRDRYGVAHVYGGTDADAVFGMLYAQCEDGFERVEMNYITALGRVSEIKGKDYLWQDLRARIILDQEVAQSRFQGAPAELKNLLQAFSDGVNFYLLTHPEVKPKLLNRFEPWHHLLFSEGSIGGDIASIGLTELRMFYTGGPRVGALDEVAPMFDSGSNGFAVAPSHSVTGNALFYINPHTTFYFRDELQVSSRQGLAAYGAVTWGQFFLYQGFNASCGWMHTSSAADVIDFYREDVLEKDGKLVYRHGTSERPVEQKRHIIRYVQDGKVEESVFTGYRTHHGPVVSARDGKWISVAMMDKPVDALLQSFNRMKANGLSDFSKNMDLRTNSSNNTVYADRSGNIGYWHGNFMPRRDTTFDWSGIVDGTNPATDWKGLHDQQEMIRIINPASGWIQNCNSTPFTATGTPAEKNSFPVYMAPDSENFRGIHAQKVLGAIGKISAEQLRELAFDPWMPGFEEMIPALIRAFDKNREVLNPVLQEPVDALRHWDFKTSATSVPMTLAMVTGRKMVARVQPRLRGQLDNLTIVESVTGYALTDLEKMQCLREAISDLQRDFGTWKVAWGELNRYQRPLGMENIFDDQAPSLPSGLGSGFWGALATFESRSFGTRKWYGASGNSFVAVVEFGKKVQARAILVGGVSCNPSSVHFSDQSSRYLEGDFKDIPFYKADVLKASATSYRPGEVGQK